MLEQEIRFGACSALVVLLWGVAFGLLVLSWLADDWALGFAGLSLTILGACILVIHDNDKTRRMVQAFALMHDAAPVRSLRD